MYNDKRILGVIPARGGSKGVPRKNIREIAGKPLIEWTIEEAKQSKYIDRLILSSEDEEIIDIARSLTCEVPFVRPKELAKDDTPGVEPVIHAIKALPEKFDYVVLLQPTSPLRNSQDIDECVELCIHRKAKTCVSVTEPDKSPYWMYRLDEEQRMRPLISTDRFYFRRQDLPKAYALNGAVYVADCQWLVENRTFLTDDTLAYRMPTERSLDIDTEMDFQFLEFLVSKGKV